MYFILFFICLSTPQVFVWRAVWNVCALCYCLYIKSILSQLLLANVFPVPPLLLSALLEGLEKQYLQRYFLFYAGVPIFNSAICAWWEFSLELAVPFFCSSSGTSGRLAQHSCALRYASWEPFLHCILPGLLSPMAVRVSQLGSQLPAAPTSSAVHCAKCEVNKVQKTPPLSWKGVGKLRSFKSGSMLLTFPYLKALRGFADYCMRTL